MSPFAGMTSGVRVRLTYPDRGPGWPEESMTGVVSYGTDERGGGIDWIDVRWDDNGEVTTIEAEVLDHGATIEILQ